MTEHIYCAEDECSHDEHSTKSSEAFLQRLVEHAPFSIFEIQIDDGTEFTRRLLTKDETDLTLFETLMAEYGIRYHRIRPATMARWNVETGRMDCAFTANGGCFL